MHDKDVYRVTEAGGAQLRGGRTTATAEELELLVRVDGVLTVGEIRAGTARDPLPDFDRLFQRLIDKGLLQPRVDSPQDRQLSLKPQRAAAGSAEAEADAGAASLQKNGFFVRIARARGDPRMTTAPLTALVVEDDPHVAGFLKHYLTFEGFEVRIAQRRSEIESELGTQSVPDLVLLDVVLPDADGFEVLERMRQDARLKDVPVIMLTAKSTREAVLRGLAAGAQGYVTKPFEVDALVEAVRSVMGLPDDPQAPAGDAWGPR